MSKSREVLQIPFDKTLYLKNKKQSVRLALSAINKFNEGRPRHLRVTTKKKRVRRILKRIYNNLQST